MTLTLFVISRKPNESEMYIRCTLCSLIRRTKNECIGTFSCLWLYVQLWKTLCSLNTPTLNSSRMLLYPCTMCRKHIRLRIQWHTDKCYLCMILWRIECGMYILLSKCTLYIYVINILEHTISSDNVNSRRMTLYIKNDNDYYKCGLYESQTALYCHCALF